TCSPLVVSRYSFSSPFSRSLRPFFFFFNATPTTEIYTLSLHDALPICLWRSALNRAARDIGSGANDRRRPALAEASPWQEQAVRSEEHTSELQSPCNLVCRLLLEKKKIKHRQGTA